MRVLHVAEAYGGGLMEVVRAIAERCAAAGHPAAIAHGRRPETPPDVPASVDDRVDVFDLRWHRRDPRSHLRVVRSLRRLIAIWRPDVVHLHSSFAGVAGVVAGRGSAPLIYTPHAFASQVSSLPPWQRRAYAVVERQVLRHVDLVGAVDGSEAAVAHRHGARAVETVYNGIPELDPGRLAVLGTAPRNAAGRPLIVATGRIVPQRRPEAAGRVLAAVADVADVEWLGGAGRDDEWGAGVRRALAAAGVQVTGWLPRERLLDELGRAEAYLHWTAWDSTSIAVLEALSRDAVVVASDTPPNRELLDPRQLCATEEEAAGLLRRIIADEDLRGELLASQRARRGAYSAEAMVRGWLRVYQRLTG